MHLVWKSIILIVKSLLATNVHCASMVKTSKESIRLRVDGGCSSLRVNLFTLKRRQHSVPDQTGFSCPQAAGSPTPEKWKEMWLKNPEKWKNVIEIPKKWRKDVIEKSWPEFHPPQKATWQLWLSASKGCALEGTDRPGWLLSFIFKVFHPKRQKTLILTGPGSRLPSPLAHWNWPVLWKSLLAGKLEQIQPVEVIEWWI